jgi:DNA transposition AAA+ family ATPase
MTKQATPVNGPVALKNVAEFMAMGRRLIDRAPHLPGIGVCSSPSGFGKTWASIFTGNKTNAVRVEVGDTWTRRTLLGNILKELGTPADQLRKRLSAADMAEMVIIALGNDPSRPLIVDEADKLVDKNMIETVRELHEHSGVPVILIGEERLPGKLLIHERVHNRVLHWMQAQPCDFEDVKTLAAAFAPRLVITDELLEAIRTVSMGRARRIVVNIERLAEFCRNKSLTHIGVEKWRGEFYTGEPPAPRNVQAFSKKAA